jgi:hypothetical protein
VDVEIHVFLTSALVGGEWSASRPGRFTPEERSPLHPFDRRLAWAQNLSGRCGEEKNLAPTGTRTPPPRPSSHSLHRLSYPGSSIVTISTLRSRVYIALYTGIAVSIVVITVAPQNVCPPRPRKHL